MSEYTRRRSRAPTSRSPSTGARATSPSTCRRCRASRSRSSRCAPRPRCTSPAGSTDDELVLNGKLADGQGQTARHQGARPGARASPSSTARRASRAQTTFPPPRVSLRALPALRRWSPPAGAPRDSRVITLCWSAMARQASASAARSIYGGFVELPQGVPGDAQLCAKQIAPPEHWDVRIVVAVANEGAKDVGSTEGMTLSEQTSPYYAAWVDCSDALDRRSARRHPRARPGQGGRGHGAEHAGHARLHDGVAPGSHLPAARHAGGARAP